MNYKKELLKLIDVCGPIITETVEKWSNGEDCYQSAYDHIVNLIKEIQLALELTNRGYSLTVLNNTNYNTMYTPKQAIEAIKARENGDWDNEQLLKLGALLPDTTQDVMRILELCTEPEPIKPEQYHVIQVTANYAQKKLDLSSWHFVQTISIQFNNNHGVINAALERAMQFLQEYGFTIIGYCAGKPSGERVDYVISTTFKKLYEGDYPIESI